MKVLSNQKELPHMSSAVLTTPISVSKARYFSRIGVLALFAAFGVATYDAPHAFAQTPAPAAKPVPDSKASGDAPDNPGPLATDISEELKPKAIQAVVKKVADWQLKVAE